MLLIPIDVYDKEGNLTKIDFYNTEAEFIIQADWDENDAQTSKNRIAFRKWAYRMMENLGYEVVK